MTLSEFLLKCIAEDDETARGMRAYSGYEADGRSDGSELEVEFTSPYDLAVTITSGRVLAECEVKQRMVERFDGLMTRYDTSLVCAAQASALHDVLLAFAAVHADRPGYQPEWASFAPATPG